MLITLPTDILFEILKFTKYKYYINLAQSCQRILAALRDHKIWIFLCHSNKIAVKEGDYYDSAKLYLTAYWQWDSVEHIENNRTRLNYCVQNDKEIKLVTKRPLTADHNEFSLKVIESSDYNKIAIILAYETETQSELKWQYSNNYPIPYRSYCKDNIHVFQNFIDPLAVGSTIKFSINLVLSTKIISMRHNNKQRINTIDYNCDCVYPTVIVPPGTILELINQN